MHGKKRSSKQREVIMSEERTYRVFYKTDTGGERRSAPMGMQQILEFIADKGKDAIVSVQREYGAKQKFGKISLKMLFEKADLLPPPPN